jgi:hypothetical protein
MHETARQNCPGERMAGTSSSLLNKLPCREDFFISVNKRACQKEGIFPVSGLQ